MSDTRQMAQTVDSGVSDRDPPSAQGIYEALRRQILDLELVPDTTLSRSALARSFGVSLTPVREALQLLEQDGLVEIVPQSRTSVSRIDRRDILEMHFLRVAAETEVVRRLARMPEASVMAGAVDVLKQQLALVGDTDRMGRFSELDRAFHLTLFQAVGMTRVHALLARKLGSLARCQRLDLPTPGKMQDILDGHTDILERIRAGDPEGAAGAMRAHLSGSIAKVAELRGRHPGFFTTEE